MLRAKGACLWKSNYAKDAGAARECSFALDCATPGKTKKGEHMADRTVRVVKFRTEYKLKKGKPVELQVEYGFAQIGGSAAKMGKTPLEQDPPDSGTFPCKGAAAGKVLLIKSVVTDVNDATNKCSVIYSLSGGVVDQKFISEGETEQDGDPILFYAWITFTV
jgi:hypothetical protein